MSIRGLDAWLTKSPYDDEAPCEMCGNMIDDCICPECEKCGSVGDPFCYKEHGLWVNYEQLHGQILMDEYWRKESLAEQEFIDWEESQRLEFD